MHLQPDGTEAAETDSSADRAHPDLTELQNAVVDLAYFRGYTHAQVDALLYLTAGSCTAELRKGLTVLSKLSDQR